jgi:hypothetical protein
MAFLIVLERCLSYAGPIAAAVLLVRLGMEGLLKRYRFFALFLACLVAEAMVLLTIRQRTMAYFYAFVLVEAILSIVQVLAVAELFSLVVREYPGIARFGRIFLSVALGLAIAIALVLGAANDPSNPNQFPILQKYFLIARMVAFTLLAFLGLTLAFLFWFPIPLSRKVLVYTSGFSVYFACRALTRVAGTLLGAHALLLLSTISLTILTSCLVFWILSLTKAGELLSVTVGHRWQPGNTQALVQQLKTINESLLGTARK